jgi:beta-lactamase class D
MKQIEPVQIWTNGILKTAEFLQVTGINDNYESSATNYFALFTKVNDAEGVESAGEQIAQGNTTISGQDYINWGDQPAMAINEWIYDWVANEINVVIL